MLEREGWGKAAGILLHHQRSRERFLPPSTHFPVGTKPEQPDLLHLLFTWLAANVSQVSTAVDGLLTNQKVRSANLQYWLLASLPIKGFQMVTEPLTLMKTATKTLPQAPAPATASLWLCCMQTSLGCFFIFFKKKEYNSRTCSREAFLLIKSYMWV